MAILDLEVVILILVRVYLPFPLKKPQNVSELQIAFERPLSISLLSHFNAHIWFLQTLIPPYHSSPHSAEVRQLRPAPLQPAQGNLGIKSTWCLPQRLSRAEYSWEAGGESANIHTSCTGAWASPSAHTHISSINLILGRRRRFPCVASLPSHLSSPLTHHHGGLQFIRQKCHQCLYILCPSNPPQQAVSPPGPDACELPGLSQAPAVRAHALHLTHPFGSVTHFGPITAAMNCTLFTLWNCHSSQLKFRQLHNGAIHTSH